MIFQETLLLKKGKQIIRDELKFKLCEQNDVKLLYFSYFDKEPENYKYKVYHDENELFIEIDNIINKKHEKI